jgi:hypothetical protein
MHPRKRSHPEAGLPHGVLPSKAASIYAWIWAQGQANHRFALARRAAQKGRTYSSILTGRWARLRAPWGGNRQPSAEELLHRLLGIKPSYANRLLRNKSPLPAHHARTLAADLRRELGEALEVAAELDRYADARDRELGLHLPTRVKDMLATKARKRVGG